MPTSAGPRRIILLCGGTNNDFTGGQAGTNVVELAESVAAHPDPARFVFHGPGVGNGGPLPGATNWDKALRWGDRVRGLVLGRGMRAGPRALGRMASSGIERGELVADCRAAS